MYFRNVLSIIYSNTDSNFSEDKLKYIPMYNTDHLIIAKININSMRNTFNGLLEGIKGKVDLLMLSETKLDVSFVNRKFFVEGYKVKARS